MKATAPSVSQLWKTWFCSYRQTCLKLTTFLRKHAKTEEAERRDETDGKGCILSQQIFIFDRFRKHVYIIHMKIRNCNVGDWLSARMANNCCGKKGSNRKFQFQASLEDLQPIYYL